MASIEESQPPSLSALARGNDMIIIDVGPDHQKYRVYKELISHYSEYFRNALKKPWKEAEDRVVELPDIEPQVFDVFVDWLYSQEVPEKNRHWIKPTDEMKANSTGHVQQVEILIIKTYVFADRFLVPKFRCAIYNHFAASLTKDAIPPYYEVIIFAFENLTEKSAMLDLLVGVHCAFWDESCDTESNGELELRRELPVDFFLRVMNQTSKMKDKEKARSLVECGCHKEKATDREGCESCRPEEKVEEVETPAEEEGDNTDTAQPNDGAAVDANLAAEEADEAEADDGAQDDDGAAANATASGDTAQPNDTIQEDGVEGATEGTVGTDGERADGPSLANASPGINDTPADGRPRVDADDQISTEEQSDGQAQASSSAATIQGEGTEIAGQASEPTEIRETILSVQPPPPSEVANRDTITTQINSVATDAATRSLAVPQGGPAVSGDGTGQRSLDTPVVDSQLGEEERASMSGSSAIVA